MALLSQDPVDQYQIASFYDATLEQRLRDYVYGNKRVVAAIALATSAIGPTTSKVLDIGCGIGISAAEMARGRDLTVHGLDISPKTIDVAIRLFGGNRLVFEVGAMQDVPRLAPYDLITMLDVYEHIPRDSWPQLHAVLAKALASDGTLVVTCPTPLHQDYLARTHPEGLQIVDEMVQPEDFLAMARDIGGVLAYFKSCSIWNSNDYFHVMIRRNPTYEPASREDGGRVRWRRAAGWLSALVSREIASRRRRVHARLGVFV